MMHHRSLTLLLALTLAGPALAKRKHGSSSKSTPSTSTSTQSNSTSTPSTSTPAPAAAEPAPYSAPAPSGPLPSDAPVSGASQQAQLTPATPPKPVAPRFTRVMVGTLKRDPEVPEKVGRFVAQALVQELRKLERMQVSSAADIDEMLSFEEQKRLVGCTDEVCLSEIVSAMGVDQLVTGTLSSTPKSHILTLNRLDVTQAKTLGTVTKQLEKKDGEEFLSAIGPAVAELFSEANLKPGLTRGVSPEVARRLNPPPLPRWSFFTALGASALVAGGGAVEALASKDAESQYHTLVTQALTSKVSGDQLTEVGNTATSRAHVANTLFIAAGGVALAAGVMAFFTDWSPAPTETLGVTHPQVSIAPGRDSGSVAATWQLP